MKRILLLICCILFYAYNAWAVPSSTLSVTPAAADGTTIAAADENSRNNAISSWANAHDHTDISQVGNTLKVGDAAAGNKTIQANNADTNKPYIRYDDTNDRWTIAVDGSTAESLVSVTSATAGFRLPQSMARSDILYFNGVNLDKLTGATAGKFLKTAGITGFPSWDDSTQIAIVNFTRDISTASGIQNVSGVGFRPRVVYFIGNLSANDAASMGFDTKDNQGESHGFDNAIADQWGTRTDSSLVFYSAGGFAQGEISSLDADGFAYKWTKNTSPTGTATIFALCVR